MVMMFIIIFTGQGHQVKCSCWCSFMNLRKFVNAFYFYVSHLSTSSLSHTHLTGLLYSFSLPAGYNRHTQTPATSSEYARLKRWSMPSGPSVPRVHSAGERLLVSPPKCPAPASRQPLTHPRSCSESRDKPRCQWTASAPHSFRMGLNFFSHVFFPLSSSDFHILSRVFHISISRSQHCRSDPALCGLQNCTSA